MAECANPATLTEINREVRRARAHFPANTHLLAALVEEVGELAQAMLQDANWREEAIHVACVAVRIYEEGDADFVDAQEDSAEELSPEEQSTWAYIQKLVDDNPEAFTEHRQRAIAEVLAHGLQACRDLHEARKVSAEALRQVYGAAAAQESGK